AFEAWIRTAILCNEAELHHRNGTWGWRGDPVDVAFLSAGHKLGRRPAALLEAWPQVNQIAFEPERRFAATFHQHPGGGCLVAVKGAPERVLEMCRLGDADRDRFVATAEEMAAHGYRVLALAEGRSETVLTPKDIPPEPSELTFLGFAGMIDPLRTGAREAVGRCLEAGVNVCMVTGDHRVTALAIARDL
ncbi:MAG: ATPase, partial [Akkermansiaceae bacterium]|nr:ATPase [Akkermansiaceae bacterium]